MISGAPPASQHAPAAREFSRSSHFCFLSIRVGTSPSNPLRHWGCAPRDASWVHVCVYGTKMHVCVCVCVCCASVFVSVSVSVPLRVCMCMYACTYHMHMREREREREREILKTLDFQHTTCHASAACAYDHWTQPWHTVAHIHTCTQGYIPADAPFGLSSFRLRPIPATTAGACMIAQQHTA